MLVIATVASLLKTRGVMVSDDEPAVDEDTAKEVPAGGPEAAAATEAKMADEADEERTRR